MNGFRVDDQRLAERAHQFDGLAERSGQIAEELNRALSGTGACWGSDEIGRSFAAVHAGPADDALGRLSGLADRLTDVGQRFAETARDYRAAESDAAARVRAIEHGR
ncbi:hypothetical protein GCM10012275_40910 [Longimycelium tulufanense]|uniref:WXG100 family type VII secretion target n=1 Tax=Longimycelium tulufanense TaxID=907463 RepID=A0A8J3FX92_9PSEU|nr:hypothetical protein [Longimycelium tulufanense]GGM66159.1 hypothetical protein GCM10012275_40910 [Longimycelium tulufanense]